MYRLLTALALFLCLSQTGLAQLSVDFSTNKTGGCSPVVVQFNAAVYGFGSGANATYHWDLGNGNTATTASPEAVYTTIGTYTVTLTVESNGQTGTATHPITVYAPPIASFNTSTPLVCGTPAVFTSTSTPGTTPSTPGGTPGSPGSPGSPGTGNSYLTSFLWDFEDGTTQQYGSSVSHSFPTTGLMSVGLTVTDNHGCTASTEMPNIVQVYPRLNAGFTSDKQVLCNVTDAVQFTNSSNGPGTITYTWDFGDNTGSTATDPAHSYTVKGNYNVKLTATSSVGCTVSATQPTPLNVANYSTDFTFPSTGICQGSYINFTDNSSPTANSRVWSVDGVPASYYSPFGSTFSPGTHTIQLANVFGTCPQQATHQITVNTVPATTPFDINFQTTCGAPAVVNFTDHSPGPGITNRDWHFLYTYGDGPTTEYTSTTSPTASHTFTANDAFTVQLQVTNAAGCSSSVGQTFYLNAPTVSIYEPHPSNSLSCNLPVTKTLAWNPPPAPLQSWTWDFGDGTTSTDANPTHTWTTPGSYGAVLHWTDVNGCTGTSVNYIQVVISKPMTIDFSGAPTTICTGGTVAFTSPSLAASDATSISWDFGDFGGGGGDHPTHSYYSAGVYTVTVTAHNAGGCISNVSKPQYITVLQAPGEYNGSTNTCDGNRNVVTFNYTQAGATSITWDFGDGGTANTAGNVTQQQHTYAHTGTYYINVSGSNGTCTNQNGGTVYVLMKQNPQLSAASTVCTGGSLNVSLAIDRNPREIGSGYFYDYTPQFFYGDGTPFAGNVTVTDPSNPYINGAFGWTLSGFTPGKSGLYVVTTSFGFNCTDVSNTIPLAVQGSATAGLTVTNSNLCYTNAVTLHDATVVGSNNPIVSWQWNFGDGTTQTAGNNSPVTHTYAHPGNYTAGLTVVDQGGCSSASAYGSANVSVNGPQVSYTYSPSRVLLGNTVYFYNGTNTYGAPSTTYAWNFGDGGTSTDVNPSHLYATPGTYTVTLTANGSAANACSQVTQQTITVYNFNSHFQIAPNYVTSGQCPPVLAQFTNTSVNYSSVAWDFGDGSTAGNLNYPSHVYTQPGAYQVTLSVYGSGGLIAQYTDSVFVRQPSASITGKTPAICIGQPEQFQGKAKGALNFVFDYGDGKVSSGLDSGVTHLYTNSGTYTAQLVVTDTVGCSVAAVTPVAVQVNPLPTVTIDPVDPHLCLGSTLQLTATGGSTYLWTPATALDNPGIATPIASPTVNTAYSVLVTDDNGCQGQANTRILVVQPETLSVSPDSTSLCFGDNLTLHAKGTDVYQWIGDTEGLSSLTDNNPVAQPTADAHYHVVGSDSYACFSDTAQIIVTVLPLPTVNGGGNVEVLQGQPVTLAATGSTDVVKWAWTPEVYLDCTDCAQPLCTPRKPETYTVTVTNDVGCHAHDTVQVKLLCIEAHVRIPEAFTPNGDGHNDRFTVLGIGFVDHIVIYDRWGVKVFERDHFYTADTDSQWDGRLHGQPAPTGVYAYFVEMSCPSGGGFARKGTVVLIR